MNSCCRVLTGLVVARMPLSLRILVSDSVTPGGLAQMVERPFSMPEVPGRYLDRESCYPW